MLTQPSQISWHFSVCKPRQGGKVELKLMWFRSLFWSSWDDSALCWNINSPIPQWKKKNKKHCCNQKVKNILLKSKYRSIFSKKCNKLIRNKSSYINNVHSLLSYLAVVNIDDQCISSFSTATARGRASLSDLGECGDFHPRGQIPP